MSCRKCNGTGRLPQHAHVDGGRCWSCGPGNDIQYDEPQTMEQIDAEMAARQAERRARRAEGR